MVFNRLICIVGSMKFWEDEMEIISVIFGILAVLSVIYFIILIISSGIGAAFAGFWLVLGGAFMAISLSLHKIIRNNVVINKSICITVGIVFLMCASFFGYVEGKIIYAANKRPKAGAEYLIVLGAGVNGTVPSQTLKNRINAAIDYLKENQDTLVIASGGQGTGEDVSEAEVIKDYLLLGGIAPEQIILEDKSTSTVENIEFSKEFIEDKDSSVVLVTSDFHIMRATKIAKMQGFTNVSGCPAAPGYFTKLNNYVREFFAVVKDKLCGNI